MSTLIKPIEQAERRLTWRNTVGIESVSLWNLFTSPLCFLQRFLRFLRSPKPTTALLIHFRSRRDSIDREEEGLFRFDDGEQVRDVGKHGEEDGFLGDTE